MKGSSGAAFIKWGQWSSTRPDMFPQELCIALSSLHAHAPIHSFSFTKQRIKLEFGRDITDMFEAFESKPIASGSIAQVYRARLDNKNVAVKVRHPNVVEQIQLDFIILKAFAAFVEAIPGLAWLNLSGSLSQFSETIGAQTKLDIEGINLILLNHNFRKVRHINFPRPILMSESVLIESYEEGTCVSEYTDIYSSKRKALPRPLDLAHFILTEGENMYLKMLLIDNLMHADLHPGNILVQGGASFGDDNHNDKNNGNENKIVKYKSKSKKKHITLVDAGMVAVLNRDEKKNYIGLLAAIGRGNGKEAADFVLKFSPKAVYTKEKVEKFRTEMIALFKKDCKGYGTGTDLGTVLRGVLGLVRVNQITIDANYATLVLNSLCLDGLGQQILPRYNVLDAAQPYLEFYRSARRTVGLWLFYAMVPISRWHKKIADGAFLRKEHRLIKKEHQQSLDQLPKKSEDKS